MKNIIVFLLVIAAYVAGYLTPKSYFVAPESHSPASTVHNVSRAASILPNSDSIANAPVDLAAVKDNKQTETSNIEQPEQIQSDKKAAVSNQMGFDSGGSSSTTKDAISDEEIDKVVPTPFNKQLKSNHGFMRDRYRKFVDQEHPSDHDRDMYNHLSDAILSNPYAKYLNIESMQCKAGLCEIRLYEQKSGVWSYIQAEMSLQDWWKFSSRSASGFDVGDKSKQGWYVLLTTD
ncbi:MAG: hypothetical protein B0W54_19920 [Cellvibrio sp. 79]|nr:MAG: hypothetical protein B0W54_19920 [Cellvibrio sp. 79]